MSRSSIPDDIQEEILLRLPVKSILCFKSVCKNWYALLSSRKFIKDHLNLSATKNNLKNRKIMIGVNDRESDDRFFSIDCASILSPASGRCDGAVLMDYPNHNNATEYHRNSIMGSCNGLILLHVDPGETLFLWNPSTREHKNIKPPAPQASNLSFGFGYDSKTDNYKLVCIVTEDSDDDDEFDDFSEVYVYTAGSWSRRQNIPYACSDGTAGVLLNGVLHWLGEAVHWTGNTATREKRIISFDINSEKFMDLPFPEETMTCSLDVGVLGDSLCLVSTVRGVGVDVWVMQNYGVRESWTKEFTSTQNIITANPSSLKFYGSVKNCEILIEADQYLGSYDRKNDRVRILDLDNTIVDYHSSGTYVESLVSVTDTMEHKQMKYIGDPHLKKNSQVTMEAAADKEAKRKRNELAESNITSKRKRTSEENQHNGFV